MAIAALQRPARTRVTAIAVLALAATTLRPVSGDAAGQAPASYILTAIPGAVGHLRDAVLHAGGAVVRDLSIIGGLEATLTPAQRSAVDGSGWAAAATPNAKVTLNASSWSNTGDTYSLYTLERYMNVDKVWAQGNQGQGVDVALIDSGVSTQQGIEASRLIYGPDLTPESINPATANVDTYGHGTHLAGIIAGKDSTITDVLNPGPTGFVGIAPKSRLISVKAADAAGNTDVSQVIAAISWVAQNKNADGMNIRVLNLSFGTDSVQDYQLDPLAYAAEQAWKQGIVVVVSAGNNNNNNSRLSDPATDPYVIAVGAMDPQGTADRTDDLVAGWSARGSGRIPDVAAPGMHVQSLRTVGSFIDTHYSGGVVGNRFLKGSGTSQSAAIVSGISALILSARPWLNNDQVKSILKSTAVKMNWSDPLPQGNGEVDAYAAVNVQSWPSSAQNWPNSTGGGTLEGARGGVHLVIDNVELNGERDINGKSWNSDAIAKSIRKNSAWSSDGWFNGAQWTGTGYDGANALASKVHKAGGWNGTMWRGSTWRSYSWESGSWSGSTWRNATWAGSAWRGTMWRNSNWAGGFADSSWDSTRWD